jgi:hypothetical protein
MNIRKKGIILTLYLLLGISVASGQDRIISVGQNTIDGVHYFINSNIGRGIGDLLFYSSSNIDCAVSVGNRIKYISVLEIEGAISRKYKVQMHHVPANSTHTGSIAVWNLFENCSSANAWLIENILLS